MSAAADSANKCSACGKPAAMRCPTCGQLGLAPTYFCSQECFKGSWSTHKLVHTKAAEQAAALLKQFSVGSDAEPWLRDRPEFKGYEFSGPLRPAKMTPQRKVPANIPRPDYADDPEGTPHSEVASKQTHTVIAQTPEQIAGIRKACQITAGALAEAGKYAKPGVTTDFLDEIVHNYIVAQGAYPSPLNYKNFKKSCCTSLNEVICHGVPDATVLKEGDILNMDVSAFYNGYHGDMNETWFIGEVDEKYKLLVNTTYQSLMAAIELVKPGALYRNLGEAISKVVHKHGFQVVRSYCGHGIGELFHCAPSVPHYAKNKAMGVMKPGHVFTIEPMINEGLWRDQLWPDEWTVTTIDGKRSAQFEHTLLVTETGVEILTKRPWGSYIDRFGDQKQ